MMTIVSAQSTFFFAPKSLSELANRRDSQAPAEIGAH